MNLVIVKHLKLGKIYKELHSKLVGRLSEKSLIINTERFNQNPYYELQFITKLKERVFVVKEWNDRFLELPHDDGIPEINSNNAHLLDNKKDKIYYLLPFCKHTNINQ